MSEILALILARGGSKSIPRKNLLPLLGKPLIAWTIGHAQASQHVTRTIVSTDDAEIAAVAREYGAETPFLRPPEFAQDDSTDFVAFRHALEWLREEENYHPELVVQLRPTGPVRDAALIDAAIEKMIADPAADALKSVSRPSESPFKMWRTDGAYLRPLVNVSGIDEPHTQPRQRLPQVFWQNGYVDVIRPRTVLEQGLMYGHTVLPFMIEGKIHELDYLSDIAPLEAALAAQLAGETPTTEAEERHSV
jgi:N-acylneuraminate cytidylyltransferase